MAVFMGPTGENRKGREREEGEERMGKEREGKGEERGEQVEGDLAHPNILAWRPHYSFKTTFSGPCHRKVVQR